MLPLLRHNVARNAVAAEVRELRWGETPLDGLTPDVVLGADLTYDVDDVALLQRVVGHFLGGGGEREFVLAYGEERYVAGVFLESMRQAGYRIEHYDSAGLIEAALDEATRRKCIVSEWTIKIAKITKL